MIWIAQVDRSDISRCVIEPVKFRYPPDGQEKTEYCLYVYGADGRCTHDYLQEELDIAQDQALRKFGVPLEAWQAVEVSDAPYPGKR